MVAAMMTAANLSARVTGWGFVVFTGGSICWKLVGLGSGQTNLVWTNAFLTLVNIVGIWRWLGRQRVYEEGGKSASEASRGSPAPTLFAATAIGGMPVEDLQGQPLGKAVEALIECTSGTVSYVVVASSRLGSVDESLRAIPREEMSFSCDRLVALIQHQEFMRRPELESGNWPAQA
ncbi:PRC-barrel domain containing protein [Sphingomonas sp. LaA6.9]|nr:PRC-barrel domain containing protein [Sphingomonas sp. LaA6.9]MCJ8159639.1 PRC-barrel domain containing protein [Sphingomonas sp. LaA6.9]